MTPILANFRKKEIYKLSTGPGSLSNRYLRYPFYVPECQTSMLD